MSRSGSVRAYAPSVPHAMKVSEPAASTSRKIALLVSIVMTATHPAVASEMVSVSATSCCWSADRSNSITQDPRRTGWPRHRRAHMVQTYNSIFMSFPSKPKHQRPKASAFPPPHQSTDPKWPHVPIWGCDLYRLWRPEYPR